MNSENPENYKFQTNLILRKNLYKDIDFSETSEKGIVSIESRFERCKFTNLRLKSFSFASGMGLSEYNDCIFDNSDLGRTTGGLMRFSRCSFQNTKMTDLQARTADFLDCVFTGKLDQVTFFGKSDIDDPLSPLRQNEVAGNDFSNADIGDINFLAGVKLEAQKLPRGGDYMVINNAESVLNKARFDALRMNNTDRGLEIIKTIDVFSEVVAGGQADIFVSKRRVPNYLKSTFDDFFDFMLPYLSHKFGSA